MVVRDLVIRMAQYARDGELCSCPIIMRNENKVELAIFTYFASDNIPHPIFGYGRLIHSNGESIKTVEKELFKSDDEFIVINELPIVSIEKHMAMYDNYYQQLQIAIDSMKANGAVENVDGLRSAFETIVPSAAIDLYKRICPSFLELMKLSSL